MAQKIIWSPESLSNLQSIYRFIANDSEYYASLFVEQFQSLKAFLIFRDPDGSFQSSQRNRFAKQIYKNYRIVYRLRNDAIEIAAITHGAKPLDDLI